MDPYIVIMEWHRKQVFSKRLARWMMGFWKRIVYISHWPADDKEELIKWGLWQEVAGEVGAEVKILHLLEKGWREVNWRDEMKWGELLFFGGGDGDHLLLRLRRYVPKGFFEELHASGISMGGSSAGAFPWFSQGAVLQPRNNICVPLTARPFGFLPGVSYCPHVISDPRRLPHFRRLIQKGDIPAGYALENGTALLFQEGELTAKVGVEPQLSIFYVEQDPHPEAVQAHFKRLHFQLLPDTS